MDYRDIGYTNFLERPADATLVSPSLDSDVMSSNAVASTIPSGSVSLAQTTLSNFVKNEDMQSENFVSGVAGSGWQIKGNGDVEFNNGTFMGMLMAASIHIPNITTAASFHTNTTGDSWWGCNVANWTASHNNANAYILSTGVAQFQSVTVTGTSNVSLGSGANILKANSTDGIWLGDAAFATAVFSVSLAGAIKATSGTIGGWVLGATSLADAAGIVGMSSAVTGGDDIRFWAGDATPASAEFRVYESGALVASSATITGSITATSGAIGGWVITATQLADVAGLVGMSSAVTGGDDIRFWCGDVTPASAPFKVTEAGVLTASSGTVGGCVLTATSIGSTTFVSGPLGSGWNISNTGTAEFQNVTVRGIIRTSVFEKDTLSVVNGLVLISKADVLNSNMTALDTSTVTITGETTFVNNEVIRCKDGTDDEWMLVTDASGAPTYVVTRDLAASYAPDTNPIWKKGTAVASTGVGTGTKTGFVLLDSSSASSPYIDIYGRNSNTYSDYTLHGRFGWLKGITDAEVGLAAADVWGLYTDNAYIKGVIVANTGYIGGTSGWVISANYIKDVAGVTGMSSVVTGGDDIRFWAGHATPASAPFYVTESGALVATSATISGSVTATSGTIGGFNIGSDYIRDAANSMGLASTVTGGDDVRFWAGDTFANRATAPFNVTEAGVLTASNANIIHDCTLEENMTAGTAVGVSNLMGTGTDIRISKAIQSVKSVAVTNLSNDKMVFIPLDSTRIFILYRDAPGVTNIKGVIATVNRATMTISLGSTVLYTAGAFGDSFTACLVDTDKVAVIYVESSDQNNKIIHISTITTATITAGAQQAFAHDGGITTNLDSCQLQTNKCMLITEENGQNGVYCFTVSGTTPTVGARVQIATGFIKTPRIVGLDTDKFVTLIAYSTDTLYCGTVSGTTITLGAVSNVADMTDVDGSMDIKRLDSTHFYIRYDGGLITCSVSGTTITRGGALAITTTAGTTMVVDSTTFYGSEATLIKKYIVSGVTTSLVGTIMETSIAYSTGRCKNGFCPMGTYFVLMLGVTGTTSIDYMIQGMSNNFLGFLQESGSRGDVKGITVRGGLGSGYTGLTQGALYTVANGALTFTSSVTTSLDTYVEQALILGVTDTQALVF